MIKCSYDQMNQYLISLSIVAVTLAGCDIKNSKATFMYANNDETEFNKKSIVMEHLTKETFLEKVFNYEKNTEWQYEGDLPCIIDFYADWCGPCKIVAPILEELSKEYDGKINIYKVDKEKERELAAAFGIRSIPSILFCPKDGQPQMAMGALPKTSLVKAINELLLPQQQTVEN
jgi:thioredoxin 1